MPPPITGEVVHLRLVASPSGNITCQLTTSGAGGAAQCLALDRTYLTPPRPADCDSDWAPWFGVDADARFGMCEPEPVDFARAQPLAYGTATVVGPIACLSRIDGMVCWNRHTRHGFRVARDDYEIF
jgi:hypothetical protein